MAALPLIPLITALVSAAGIGTSIYEGAENRSAQSDAQKAQQKALLQQQQAQANQANLTKQEAVLGSQGQAQAQTGGSLTDPGTTALTDLLAGYPGYQSGTSGTGTTPAAAAGGSGAPGSTGAGGSSPDITAILAALRNGSGEPAGGVGSGSLSGGNWQPQAAQPQQWNELSNPVLS